MEKTIKDLAKIEMLREKIKEFKKLEIEINYLKNELWI